MRRFALGGTIAVLAIALSLVTTPVAHGQSVEDVVERVFETIERSAQGIDDYTLVQRVMGFENRTYFEKVEVGGRTLFQPRGVAAGGMGANMGDFGTGDISEFADALIEHGRYAGTESVDGRSAHVIEIDDVSALDIAVPSGPDDMDFVPRSARLFVDTDRNVPVKMEYSGEATTDTGTHDVTTTVEMLDYREVQGLLVPYRTVITIDGIGAMVDPEMQAELDEMMARLEEMDPQQRAMMERMLGPQIEQIQNMMGGGGEAMTIESTVSEVLVNAGPPGR